MFCSPCPLPTCFGSRSFAAAASTIWNPLPMAIRISVSNPCTSVFGDNSKLFSITQLSRLLNPPPHSTPLESDAAGLSLTLCALQTYLLTYLKPEGVSHLRTHRHKKVKTLGLHPLGSLRSLGRCNKDNIKYLHPKMFCELKVAYM